VLSGVTGVIANLCKIVVFAGVLFFLNWWLALASLIAVPVWRGPDVRPEDEDQGQLSTSLYAAAAAA
jgi:Zn-dependent protease